MEKNANIEKPRLAPLAHRRVGLMSVACAVVGAGWLSSVVVPSVQKENRKNGVVVGAFGIPLPFADKDTVVPSPAPQPRSEQDFADSHPTTARFVNAPVGTALQMVYSVARVSVFVAPSVDGKITYSTSKPLDFRKVAGYLIGAAPAPGVQIDQRWDKYVILPRNVRARRGDADIYNDDTPPVPVPVNAPGTTYRMAGYVELQIQGNFAPAPYRLALIEARVPGVPPIWHTVQVGDILRRKSAQDTARETNPRANIDIAPMVDSIEADAVILRGGGDKKLRIPMGAIGVADTFGTEAASTAVSAAPINDLDQRSQP